ncbi:hypothetical protein [Rhodococcus sp. NPDC004095]
MKKKLVLAAVTLLVPFGLAACSGGNESEPTATPSPTTSVGTVSTTTASLAPAQTTTPEAAAITFECGDLTAYESGTAFYSDGSVGYEEACDTYVPLPTTEAPAKVLQYCDYPGTAVYTDGTYSTTDPACAAMRAEAEARNNANTNPNPGGGYPYNPEEDRNGDGVVNGYERCGVLCGDAPTSGDIQTQHGCEQGYIGREICEQYGW